MGKLNKKQKCQKMIKIPNCLVSYKALLTGCDFNILK